MLNILVNAPIFKFVFVEILIELQIKWPVLHWPGHMGVAWNVSTSEYYSNCHDQCVCNPPVCVAGASRSTAPWAGRGTPSLPCLQITSSCLEVSLLNERPWVRLRQCSVAAKTFFCWSDAWNEGYFVFRLSGDAWLYYVSKNEWKPFKHSHTGRPRQVPLKCQHYAFLL